MKIALVHKRLDLKGGTERDLYRTVEGLRDLGHEVHLFCSEYDVAAPEGVASHRVAVAPFGRTARLWSFALNARAPIERVRCDVVVNFGRFIHADVLRCGGGTHRGFLRQMGADGGIVRRTWQTFSAYHRSLLAIEKRQFGCARLRRIIAVSEIAKNDIIANYRVDGKRITVLYNGVDEKRFHPARTDEFRRSIRERWKIPLDAPLVLFVGSGFRRKGLDRLVSAWHSSRLAGFFLLVVGDDANLGRYRAWADSIAGGRINFTGHQDDIENYYAASDIVALPSIQEAFGNVVLEALSSGRPVVVSRHAGAAELLTAALAEGIVDRPDDPKELEAVLLSAMNKAKDSALSREARRIGEQHSWKSHFRRWQELLLDAGAATSVARVS